MQPNSKARLIQNKSNVQKLKESNFNSNMHQPNQNRLQPKSATGFCHTPSNLNMSLADTTCSTEEVTLKDKFTDFCSGLYSGNSKIVQQVERMVSEQRSEIDLLNSRIDLLHKQIDRQKTYYQKRELILREMYEEEISLLESYSQNQSTESKPVVESSKLLKDHAGNLTSSSRSETTISQFSQTNHTITKAACTSPIKVKTRNTSVATSPPSVNWKAAFIDPSKQMLKGFGMSTKSPRAVGLKPHGGHIKKAIDAACCTSPQRFITIPSQPVAVTKAVQSDLQLAAADKTADIDYYTCVENSPLIREGQKLSDEANKQIDEDEAFVEAERMHEKTQYLYGKLNAVLKELHSNSTDIVDHKPTPKRKSNRHRKPSKHRQDLKDAMPLQKSTSAPKLQQDQALQVELKDGKKLFSDPASSSDSKVQASQKGTCTIVPFDKANAGQKNISPEPRREFQKQLRDNINNQIPKPRFMQLNSDQTVNSDVSTLQTMSGL